MIQFPVAAQTLFQSDLIYDFYYQVFIILIVLRNLSTLFRIYVVSSRWLSSLPSDHAKTAIIIIII